MTLSVGSYHVLDVCIFQTWVSVISIFSTVLSILFWQVLGVSDPCASKKMGQYKLSGWVDGVTSELDGCCNCGAVIHCEGKGLRLMDL